MQARKKPGGPAAFARVARGTGLVAGPVNSARLKDILVIAEEAGLLNGARTKIVRGRMPKALVNRAKARTGIKRDTELLEVALANLAVADDFPEWLLSRKGTVSKDLDLEF